MREAGSQMLPTSSFPLPTKTDIFQKTNFIRKKTYVLPVHSGLVKSFEGKSLFLKYET